MRHTVISSGVFYKGVTVDLKSPIQSNQLTYISGTTVIADSVDLDPASDCGAGISFCRTLAEALKFARSGTVVTVRVPHDVVIVDTGEKLRAQRVKVGDVVDLTSANLRSANLRSANLRFADLTSADLRSADLRYANLRSANGDRFTLLPTGWRVTDAGLIVKL